MLNSYSRDIDIIFTEHAGLHECRVQKQYHRDVKKAKVRMWFISGLKHSSLRSFGSRNQTRPLGLNTRKILITTTSPERDGNTPFSFSDLVTNLWWVLEGRRWNVRLQWHGYKSSKRHCCLLGASSQSDKQPEKHLTLSVTSVLWASAVRLRLKNWFFWGVSWRLKASVCFKQSSYQIV